jgi:hypothetical protein
VPKNVDVLASSLEMPTVDGAPIGDIASAPEFVHARTRIDADGNEHDLNALKAVADEVHNGNYDALHYLDFTGEGWVSVHCPPLTDVRRELGAPKAAYSLVAPPDFVYRTDQRELSDWSDTLPNALRVSGGDDDSTGIWGTPPNPLSDQRFPANVQLADHPFDETDDTMTAIVSMFGEVSLGQTVTPPVEDVRHSHLPDDAAGIFAPGWDVSLDFVTRGQNTVVHLAAYGLGSPFPEDAKLCAALSTFWPAAAPDSTRVFLFGDGSFTVAPLTDEEIGLTGPLAWDAVVPPRISGSGSRRIVSLPSFDHTDYVKTALENRFTFRVTAHVGSTEYIARVKAMDLGYRALKARIAKQKSAWIVLSFRRAIAGSPQLTEAEQEARTTLPGSVFHVVAMRHARPKGGNPLPLSNQDGEFRIRLPLRDPREMLIDPENNRVLLRREGKRWKNVDVTFP